MEAPAGRKLHNQWGGTVGVSVSHYLKAEKNTDWSHSSSSCSQYLVTRKKKALEAGMQFKGMGRKRETYVPQRQGSKTG